jgi:hypothetical protein
MLLRLDMLAQIVVDPCLYVHQKSASIKKKKKKKKKTPREKNYIVFLIVVIPA